MPEGIAELADPRQTWLGPPVWKVAGTNPAGQRLVRNQYGDVSVAPGQGDVGTGEPSGPATTQEARQPAPPTVPPTRIVQGFEGTSVPYGVSAPGLPQAPAVSGTPFVPKPEPPGFAEFWPQMTRRESHGGKNEPNYRYDATHTAGGPAQITDTTWRKYAGAAGVDLRQYPYAMSAPDNVQRAVAAEAYRAEGPRPWAASEPFGQAYRDQAQRNYETSHQHMQAILSEINKASPGSGTYQKLIGQALERSDELQKEFMNTMRHPPVEKPIDAMANFGSLATVIGIFGGLFARKPLTASLNAAGMAMQALNAGQHEAFTRAYDTWKTQTTLLHEILSEQNTQIRNVLEMENLDERQKMDRINILATAFGRDDMAKDALLGNLEKVYRYDQIAQKLPLELKELQARIEREQAQTGILRDTGGAKPGTEAYLTQQRIREAQAASETPLTPQQLSDVATKAHSEWAGSGAVGRQSAGEWSKDAIEALVLRARTTGDMSVLSQLPRSGPARKQFEEALAEDLKQQPGGLAGGVASMVMNSMRMAEARSAAQAAGRITMNTHLYAAEAVGAAKLVVDASKGVPRTNLPAINVIEEAGLKHVGDPNIVRLGVAINALLNAYGKMSNPTGTGIHDADKARLEGQLSAALSQGQIEAGTDQIVQEGLNLSRAAEQAQGEVLSGIVPKTPGATSETPSPAPPSAGIAHPDQIQGGWLFKWSTQEGKYVADHKVQ